MEEAAARSPRVPHVIIVALMALKNDRLTPETLLRLVAALGEVVKHPGSWLCLCGGPDAARDSIPNPMSEAEAAYQWLDSWNDFDSLRDRVIRESASTNSLENAIFAKHEIERLFGLSSLVHITAVSSSWHSRFFDAVRMVFRHDRFVVDNVGAPTFGSYEDRFRGETHGLHALRRAIRDVAQLEEAPIRYSQLKLGKGEEDTEKERLVLKLFPLLEDCKFGKILELHRMFGEVEQAGKTAGKRPGRNLTAGQCELVKNIGLQIGIKGHGLDDLFIRDDEQIFLSPVGYELKNCLQEMTAPIIQGAWHEGHRSRTYVPKIACTPFILRAGLISKVIRDYVKDKSKPPRPHFANVFRELGIDLLKNKQADLLFAGWLADDNRTRRLGKITFVLISNYRVTKRTLVTTKLLIDHAEQFVRPDRGIFFDMLQRCVPQVPNKGLFVNQWQLGLDIVLTKVPRLCTVVPDYALPHDLEQDKEIFKYDLPWLENKVYLVYYHLADWIQKVPKQSPLLILHRKLEGAADDFERKQNARG